MSPARRRRPLVALDEARELLSVLRVRLMLDEPEPEWRRLAVIYGAPSVPRDDDA